MRRRRIHAPTWTAALKTVLDMLLFVGGRTPPITDEQDRILTEVFLLCDALRTSRHRHTETTNRELAAKYGICERTVRNWRRDGCPFAKGQSHVLKWIAQRRYAPAGTNAKFKRQLVKRRMRREIAIARQHIAELRELRWLHLQHGSEPPDWMGNIRARRGKVPFYDVATGKPLETSLHYKAPASANS